jgi:hypothetical protein
MNFLPDRHPGHDVNPTVEHDAETATISGISTWPGWQFVVALDESWVKVIAPDHETVSARAWRSLPISYVLRLAGSTWTTATLARMVERRESGRGNPRRPVGGSTKHNAVVAHTYRSALLRGAKPRDAVAEFFEVSEKTADRWLREAREAGELGTYLDEKRAARNG